MLITEPVKLVPLTTILSFVVIKLGDEIKRIRYKVTRVLGGLPQNMRGREVTQHVSRLALSICMYTHMHWAVSVFVMEKIIYGTTAIY